MKQTFTVEGMGKVTLTDNQYLSSGGEGSIYVKDDLAYKIYHDPSKMIPTDKIKELSKIKSSQVLIPQQVIYDSAAIPVGYVMNYIKNTTPICKLFTRAFKQRNGLTNEDITFLIEKIQNVIENDIHPSKCLVVDLNELNLLVSSGFDIPYFIDCDSYGTPSYPATAIMQSIKDPKVKNNKWTKESDWYSFAIVAFQMWINIHPFKGSHPDYKPNEFLKRMEDGISVFDPKASIPSVCNNFSVIPPSHLKWFKQIFLKNERCAPPKMGEISILISAPQTFNIVSSNNAFIINNVEECIEGIVNVFNFMGINYIIGTKNVYKGKIKLPVDIVGFDKVLICETNSISPVVCKLKNGQVYMESDSGGKIGEISAKDMMYRNSCVYTIVSGKMIENSFNQIGKKIIHSIRVCANIFELSTQIFDGVAIQDLMGNINITLPYEKGKCTTIHAKELDGYRILDARSEKNICAIMAEKKGEYYSFVITFNANYDGYAIRTNKENQYFDINLTVLPNGVCVMADNDSVEIFKDKSVKKIENPPFNSSTRLFNYSGGIFYIDGEKIISAKVGK